MGFFGRWINHVKSIQTLLSDQIQAASGNFLPLNTSVSISTLLRCSGSNTPQPPPQGNSLLFAYFFLIKGGDAQPFGEDAEIAQALTVDHPSRIRSMLAKFPWLNDRIELFDRWGKPL